MLPKENRADKKAIERIFKEGRFLNSQNLTFKYIPLGRTYGNSHRSDLGARISFIAPKSVAKLAVKRNSLRRSGYNALKAHLQLIPAGIIGVFIFKKAESNILTLENEIKTILSKIN